MIAAVDSGGAMELGRTACTGVLLLQLGLRGVRRQLCPLVASTTDMVMAVLLLCLLVVYLVPFLILFF